MVEVGGRVKGIGVWGCKGEKVGMGEVSDEGGRGFEDEGGFEVGVGVEGRGRGSGER